MSETFEFSQDEEVKRNFEKIGLKFNPFPIGGEPSREQPYVQISKDVTNQIVDFVDSVTSRKRWHGLSVIGDNGTGKTRLFFSLEENINRQLKYANAVYINDPPSDPVRFFQKVINSTNLDKLIHLIVNKPENGLEFEKIVDKNIKHQMTVTGLKKAQIADEKKLINDISIFLADKLKIDENLRKAYSILIIHFLALDIFKEKEIEFSLKDSAISEINEVKRYVSGEPLQKSILDKLGLKNLNVGDSIMEKIIFPAYLEFNHFAGKEVVYILIDEFQFVIENVSKSKIASILEMIIATAQSNPSGFCMVLACLPDSWNYATRISNSFSERFSKQISMPPLKKEIALDMIKKYLDFGRIEDRDDLYPFNEEAVFKLLQLSQYNVRDFLILSGNLLNIFAQDEKAKVIDLSFVKDVLKSRKDFGLDLWL